MDDIEEFVRNRIRQAREDSRLSQRELADRLGVGQVTISDLERGQKKINVGQLFEIARALGKSVLFFLPIVREGELNDEEQTLVGLFRRLAPYWRDDILNTVRGRVEYLERVEDLHKIPPKLRDRAASELAERIVRGSYEQARKRFEESIAHLPDNEQDAIRASYYMSEPSEEDIVTEIIGTFQELSEAAENLDVRDEYSQP